eukprot:128470-Pyramimonas_sp.AAC.1
MAGRRARTMSTVCAACGRLAHPAWSREEEAAPLLLALVPKRQTAKRILHVVLGGGRRLSQLTDSGVAPGAK